MSLAGRDIVPGLVLVRGPRDKGVFLDHIAKVGYITGTLIEEGDGDLLLKGDDNAVRINGIITGLKNDLAVLYRGSGHIEVGGIKSGGVVGRGTRIASGNLFGALSPFCGKCHTNGMVCLDIRERILIVLIECRAAAVNSNGIHHIPTTG